MRIRQVVQSSCGLCAMTVVALGPASAQLSPGPLARVHSSLEGAEHCLDCHGRGDDTLNENCTACHTEIAFQREAALGLHGAPAIDDCAGCHPDHAGLEFELIDWGEGGRAAFDHRRTGWPLLGKHAQTRCRDCHKVAYQSGRVADLIKRADRDLSWLGLERMCGGCHSDPHGGRLDADCAACHDSDGWSPAPRFEHAATRFPLSGRHMELDCRRCHRSTAQPSETATLDLQFGPLTHDACSDCHDDPHAGRLGPACESCHTTQGFEVPQPEGFDHSRTRYPLEGRHASLACASCHDPQRAWGKRPAFGRCENCHADSHRGTATLQGRAADCASCHSVAGFERSTYGVDDHRNAAFPLEGAHARVTCRDCHRVPGNGASAARSAVRLRPVHAACADCHADAHAAQLAARPDAGACESCHRVQGWRPSTFDLGRHARLELPLSGRHAEIECVACHGEVRAGLPPHPASADLGSARLALAGIAADCVSCHVDPHEARLPGCGNCHGWSGFRPSAVDVEQHRRFDYPLEGAHRSTPCNGCHTELNESAVASSLRQARHTPRLFELAERDCEACHESPHGEQFAEGRERRACESCHAPSSFSPATGFDHERDAAFALRGAHERLDCAACHPTQTGSGDAIVRYRPLPHRCRDCHSETPGGSR